MSFVKEQEAYGENPDGTAGVSAIVKMEQESSARGSAVHFPLTNRSLPSKVLSDLRTDDHIL